MEFAMDAGDECTDEEVRPKSMYEQLVGKDEMWPMPTVRQDWMAHFIGLAYSIPFLGFMFVVVYVGSLRLMIWIWESVQ